ncbi:MAG: amidohydrolase family protein [Planctomycetes bacterium]|nr:amidohydrolase family protein [Planctomycetota bacterium]
MKRALWIALGLAFVSGVATSQELPWPLAAADDEPAPAEADGADAEGGEDAAGEDDEDDAPRWFALRGGSVYQAGAWLEGATVLGKDGRIVAVGTHVVVPADAEVLDVTGYRVYPGLVAFDSRGIVGQQPGDSTDVFGLELNLALATGITTVGAGSQLAKLTWGTLEGHDLGESGLVRIDISQASLRARLREDLARVEAYLRDSKIAAAAKARGEEAKEPDSKFLRGKFAAYRDLLVGTKRALVNADTAGDLRALTRLTLRFGFRAVVKGAVEGWTLPGELGRAGISVVATPRERREPDPDRMAENGWSIENAARLHEHGVEVAILPRSPGISMGGLAGGDLLTFPLEAAFAMRGGLSEDAALEAITIVPARLLGIADRVGTLEVGKDLDAVIVKGDLLHYQTLVEWTVVNGRVAYDKAKDTLLQHVRPRDGEGENLPVPLIWPRRGNAPDSPPRPR